MAKRRFVTLAEAISLLPEGEYIHTFYNYPLGLVGADWDRAEIIQKFKKSDKIELTGTMARSTGHGLAVYNDNTKYQSEILFVTTDMEKLDAFDPLEVEDGTDN